MPGQTHKLVLDGDYGIDDSMATLYLAAQPGYEIVAVGSVHGNAEAAVAARNAITVLELAGLPHVPLAIGAARPLAQPLEVRRRVHGDDGLGGAAPAPTGHERPPVPVGAAVQLVDAVRANTGCTIVATGPLTNLAQALMLDPAIAALVDRVVVMGGTLLAPGNIGSTTEANFRLDPEAADLVLTAPWPVTVVGLDVTMQVWLEGERLQRIRQRASPRSNFVWSVVQSYLGYYQERYGRAGCPLHDPTAACLALHPEFATYMEAPARVELTSPADRGMLIAGREVPTADGDHPVRIATGIAPERVLDDFLEALLD